MRFLRATSITTANGSLCQILLELEISICRDERIEVRRRKRQKLSVLGARPAFVPYG